MRIVIRLAVIALAAASCMAAFSQPAAAVTAPSVPVFTGLKLADPSVMQSMAYDPVHQVWVFAQLTWGRPASSGDLTLTRFTVSGGAVYRLGWMYLTGFGHGLSISAEPCGEITCVWTETHAMPEPALGWAAPGAYGNQIARFGWRDYATITPHSPGVTLYAPNGGQPEQTPSVNAAAGLIAVQYWSAAGRVFRWAVYPLARFKRHDYTALARFTAPAALAFTEQGWALVNRTTILNWQGEARPADDATLTWVSMSGTVTGQARSTAGAGLSYREPEGATVAAGKVCTGFASGPAGARRANVYCQARP